MSTLQKKEEALSKSSRLHYYIWSMQSVTKRVGPVVELGSYAHSNKLKTCTTQLKLIIAMILRAITTTLKAERGIRSTSQLLQIFAIVKCFPVCLFRGRDELRQRFTVMKICNTNLLSPTNIIFRKLSYTPATHIVYHGRLLEISGYFFLYQSLGNVNEESTREDSVVSIYTSKTGPTNTGQWSQELWSSTIYFFIKDVLGDDKSIVVSHQAAKHRYYECLMAECRCSN